MLGVKPQTVKQVGCEAIQRPGEKQPEDKIRERVRTAQWAFLREDTGAWLR